MSGSPSLLGLSDELLLLVLDQVDGDSPAPLLALGATCKRLHEISQDDAVWNRLFLRHFLPERRGAGPSSLQNVPVMAALRNVLLPAPPSSASIAGDYDEDATLEKRLIKRLPARFYRSQLLRDRASLRGGSESAGSSSRAPPPEQGGEDAPAIQHDVELERALRHQGLDWRSLYRTLYRLATGSFNVTHLRASDAPEAGGCAAAPSPVRLGKRRAQDPPGARHTQEELHMATVADDEDARPNKRTRVAEDAGGAASRPSAPRRPRTLVQNTAHYIFVAQRADDDASLASATACEVQVFPAQLPTDAQAESGPGRPNASAKPCFVIDCAEAMTRCAPAEAQKLSITDIRADAAPSAATGQRLLVALNTGHIALYQVPLPGASRSALSPRLIALYTPPSHHDEDEIVATAYHEEILVTCTRGFRLSVLHLLRTSKQAGLSHELKLAHRLKAHSCWWPAVISLTKLPTWADGASEAAASYKLCVAYCTPQYPSAFTVGLQELLIRCNPAGPLEITSSRHATALPRYTRTPLDTRGKSMFRTRIDALQASHAPAAMPSWATVLPGSPLRRAGSVHGATSGASSEPPSSDTGRMVSITLDDPFVVVGSNENILEVYEILGGTRFCSSRTNDGTPQHRRTLRLMHRGSVHGHTGSVESVSLQDGRLVSGSTDGCVIIWKMEEADEAHRPSRGRRRISPSVASGKSRRSARALSADSTRAPSIFAPSLVLDRQPAMRHVITLSVPSAAAYNSTSRPRLTFADAVPEDETSSSSDDDDDEQGPATRRGRSTAFDSREAIADEHSLTALALKHLRTSDRAEEAEDTDPSRRGIVRFVATAFDQIVSVRSAGPLPHAEEVVQVWNFV